MIEYENLQLANASFSAGFESAYKRVYESGWYILGQEVKDFELEFASYLDVAHCVGVANGLDALTLSLRALEMPAGAEVLVASNTYIATILAILQAGLKPILVEPDIATYNIDPCRLPEALTDATRAVCVTHLYGKACRMDAIMEFARKNRLQVIEDCAQSHGAKFQGQMTGTFGIAGCFSFYPTKNLGALGDAGAITTNDADFADRLRHWRNYGSKQKYVNVYAGVNSRLDELQAAFLRVKLSHLDRITEHKRRLAALYFENLPNGLVLPKVEPEAFDVYHIYPIRHPERDRLRAFLMEQGVKTEVHYPIAPHHQQAMRGLLQGNYPVAEEIHATELSLPISFATTEVDVLRVCTAVSQFLA
jgi:dTDP-4-amino-4,6-dideoxygalactose transaminase